MFVALKVVLFDYNAMNVALKMRLSGYNATNAALKYSLRNNNAANVALRKIFVKSNATDVALKNDSSDINAAYKALPSVWFIEFFPLGQRLSLLRGHVSARRWAIRHTGLYSTWQNNWVKRIRSRSQFRRWTYCWFRAGQLQP